MAIKWPINGPFQNAEALFSNKNKWIRPILVTSRRSTANRKYVIPMWQSAALNRRWYDEPATLAAGGTCAPAAVAAAAVTALTTGPPPRKQHKLSMRWQPRQQRQQLQQRRRSSIASAVAAATVAAAIASEAAALDITHLASSWSHDHQCSKPARIKNQTA